MATTMVRQTMFTTGEVDVITFNRTELEDYLTAAQSLLNCEVGTTGLSKKRKGTKFLYDATTKAEDTSQLYEFIDNGNLYLLVSSNLIMKIFSVATDGTVTFYSSVVTPYVSADLASIDYTLDNDVIILTHPSYPPARIYISSYGPVVFTYESLQNLIYPYPAYDFGNINYNTFTVSTNITSGVLTLNFTGLGSDPGFTTDWIGGQIIGLGNNATDPLGAALITNVVPYSGGTVTFTATITVPFSSNLPTIGNQYVIKQPAFSSTLGWPSHVIYYQNRLWYANAGTLNNTIFGSKINLPLNFDAGIGSDTDAIIYTIGQSNSGNILWMNGGKQFEVYTENFEFVAPQEMNVGLTPGTFSIRQQSAYGTNSNIKPITYINDSYYLSKTGKAIINYKFDGIGQSYTSTNISLASSHLVKNPINRALLRGNETSQDNFIYFLNQDNTLTSFQFATEYKLAALTPVVFQENINILDIVNLNNEIYFLKKYTLTSKYVLEKFVSDFKIDSYQTATMTNGVITGLGLLEGYFVQVIYNNQDYGQYTVVDEQITVDNPPSGAVTVQVGLLYDMNLTPMYLFGGPTQSNYFKKISKIFVDYYQSLDFYIDGVLVNYQNFDDIQAGLPLQLQTGTATIYPVNGWNQFATFSITQSSPFDCQITGIAYQITESII